MANGPEKKPAAMSDEEMWETIRSMIAEMLSVDPSKITENASFTDDLMADSLSVLEVLTEIEEKFRINIPHEKLTSMRTVGDAIRYVKEHRQAAGASAP